MNTIDEAMIAILQKRLELSKLSYSDDTYDDVEEVLHDLEDDFNEKYGDQLEEILDKVWGNEVVVGGRTIDVHIRKLREKIGDDFFKTIKGVGYKIEF